MTDKLLGVGLDCGTMNLVSARREPDRISTRRVRNAYLLLQENAKKALKISNTSYISRDEGIAVLGDSALKIATGFDKEVSRPLSAGLIASGDRQAMDILGILIREVLGPPKDDGEICFFSVPASPMDSQRDIVYHTGVLEKIIAKCGYEPYASNEAMAIIFSETEEEHFSGISMSFGSGMVNIAVAISALSRLECSVSQGGDSIDFGVAQALNMPQSLVCARKEEGVNLKAPKDEIEEALVFYYRNLIREVLRKTAQHFKATFPRKLTDPLPLIISGGTSLAGGFVDLFKEVFKKHQRHLPFTVSEVRHAAHPLNAVAYGLLTQAVQEYQGDNT